MVLEIIGTETQEGEEIDVYELREIPGGSPILAFEVMDRFMDSASWQVAMDQLRTPPKDGVYYPRIICGGIGGRGRDKFRLDHSLRIHTRHYLNGAPAVIEVC